MVSFFFQQFDVAFKIPLSSSSSSDSIILWAHKDALKNFEYFRTLFNFKDTNEIILEEGTSCEAFSYILYYIYSDITIVDTQTLEEISEIIYFAKQYLLMTLYQEQKKNLHKRLKLTNAIQVFKDLEEITTINNNPKRNRLYKYALIKIFKSISQVLKSDEFLQLSLSTFTYFVDHPNFHTSEVNILELIKKYIRLHNINDTDIVKILFNSIRFHLMTSKQLVELIKPLNILSTEDLLLFYEYAASKDISLLSTSSNIKQRISIH